MNKPFYITTTTPYVNADPHIGFGLEIVAADVIARYHRLIGDEVALNTGTDEHGQKIYTKALEKHQNPQAYVDEYAQKFKALKDWYNISYTHFIRTTEPRHIKAAQTMWRLCDKNGDIYKDNYTVKYCVGCEMEKTDSELENGKCPLHPNREIEVREEENYFFRFSKYQQPLLDFYQKHPDFVKPDTKMKELVSFVKRGLKDFSISRLKDKMPWGVPVPGDDEHVMYVWFDALNVYISTIDWPNQGAAFDKFWPAVQICGKDNLRQQSAMWQAMLMSAGLANSKTILVNGFISVEGQKMSKSLGNVIAPQDMVDRYGVDGARWLLMELGPIGNDMDVSQEKFDAVYTASLANGWGNVCSRVAKLAENSGAIASKTNLGLSSEFSQALDVFDITTAFEWCIKQIALIDEFLSTAKPWKLSGEKQKQVVSQAINQILELNFHLQIFMPSTSDKVRSIFEKDKVSAIAPLFPRV